MSRKTDKFEEGLSGKRPGNFYVDEEAHRAQEAGYREYLSNEDLANRLRRPDASDSSSTDYGVSSEPLNILQRMFWLAFGSILLYFDFWISDVFTKSTVANGAGDYWPLLIVSMVIVPGGILGWPGLMMCGFAFTKD